MRLILLTIGVLALQGSVEEHVKMLAGMDGISPRIVKEPKDMEGISGLILPGGESTAIGKMLRDYGLREPIIKQAAEGMPIWGTCAGMILLAKEIADEECVHLGIMDITVRRNAYGGQLDSFRSDYIIPGISTEPLPLIFIRAPWVEKVGEDVRILAKIEGRIVAAQQGNMLVTSFHPELSGNPAFHSYFCKMAAKWVN